MKQLIITEKNLKDNFTMESGVLKVGIKPLKDNIKIKSVIIEYEE